MKFLRPILIIFILFIVCLSIFTTSFCVAKEAKIVMFLWNGETDAEKGFKEAIKEELPEWKINYTLLDTFKSSDRLRDLVATLDESDYNLIYTYGSTITSRVAKNFKNTPIVFNIVFDPITYKIIESWDNKQSNLTGASNSIPFPIMIRKIHEVFGEGDIGLIFNPLDKKSVKLSEEMSASMEKSGFVLLPFEFREDFNTFSAYLNSIKGRVKCIYIPTEHLVIGYLEKIMAYINKDEVRIPTCVTGKTYLSMGALLSINADYLDVGKTAGKIAAQVLQGTSPADIPIKRPVESNLTLYMNSLVLKRLNIKLPEGLKVEYVN